MTAIYHTTPFMTLPRHDSDADDAPTIETLFGEIRTLRRTGVAVLVFVAACALLSAGAMLGGGNEFRTLEELTKKVNKLRAEVAVRDARFQATKGVLQGTGRLDDLLKIHGVIENYALPEMRNGAAFEKTSEEVRREVCDRLAAEGFPCVP